MEMNKTCMACQNAKIRNLNTSNLIYAVLLYLFFSVLLYIMILRFICSGPQSKTTVNSFEQKYKECEDTVHMVLPPSGSYKTKGQMVSFRLTMPKKMDNMISNKFYFSNLKSTSKNLILACDLFLFLSSDSKDN